MKFSTYRYQEKNSRNTYKHRGCGCFLIIQVSNSGYYNKHQKMSTKGVLTSLDIAIKATTMPQKKSLPPKQ